MEWTERERHGIYREMIARYGTEAQLDHAVEECAEFIVAVQKLRRAIKNEPEKMHDRHEDVIEEIADVFIMMEQAKLCVGEEGVKAMERKKLTRLSQRIIKSGTKEPT